MLRLFDLQQGKGLVKVNGQPLNLVQPEILRFKVRFRIPQNTCHLAAENKGKRQCIWMRSNAPNS